MMGLVLIDLGVMLCLSLQRSVAEMMVHVHGCGVRGIHWMYLYHADIASCAVQQLLFPECI